MKRALCNFVFHRLLGWKTDIRTPHYDKCVICVAPHTSNWDLFIGLLCYGAMGKKASFMMKKGWFFFPVGLIFRATGGIPIDRSRNTSMVSQMVERFTQKRSFHLAITPEATRKPNSEWKTGFYYIALKAQVPILLAGMDYPSKTVRCMQAFIPQDGNAEMDMCNIKQYFKSFIGKNPKNFAI